MIENHGIYGHVGILFARYRQRVRRSALLDSDSQLRAKGIQSYGLGPAVTEEDRAQYGAHSDVERLLESSLYRFVEFTWNIVSEIVIKK